MDVVGHRIISAKANYVEIIGINELASSTLLYR